MAKKEPIVWFGMKLPAVQPMKKYNDLPASLTNVCLLHMYNSGMGDKIMTLDADFHIFRVKNSKPLKLITPA